MPSGTYRLDARYFQLVFQLIFLLYGLLCLEWHPDYPHYLATFIGCWLFTFLLESIKQKKWIPILGKNGFVSWGLSVSISAFGLCLLLKTSEVWVSMLAAFLTVGSKYVFRTGRKHIFNPSAFGIAAVIVLTGKAWLSPAQWGTGAVLVFSVLVLGTIVVTSVQKLDTSLGFLLAFAGLLFWRQVVVLHWPADYFIHSLSTGSLLLFTFFMISDPRTVPDNRWVRFLWSMLVGVLSFYLATFKWINNAPIWSLVICAPLVPLLDRIFKAKAFQWMDNGFSFSTILKLRNMVTKLHFKKAAALVLLVSLAAHDALAFCGFYVSKADGTLKNKTSQVIMVRDGNRNVITMYNDFKGSFKDFAMVVPVPVVLKKKDIKVVDQAIFNTLNDYSKPRLVEYYDQNPCFAEVALQGKVAGVQLDEVVVTGYGTTRKRDLGVKVEAKYLVGEYDILILSATESAGLKTWLTENGYKIPAGAEEVLDPYIKSSLKFFVVKVNEGELKKLRNNFLRPIQISFASPKFMLPIRLGMANADGDQDLIVYAFTKSGRVETTNYRNVSLPTGENIPLFVKENFGNFYSNLFQHQWNREGKDVTMLEYAWNVSPSNFMKCDPCVAQAPAPQDLAQAGVWWINRDWNDYSDVDEPDSYSDKVFFTRLHIRYNRKTFPQDLMFQVTPNEENFQSRYVITHPAQGSFDCPSGKKYVEQLKKRRKQEMENLSRLTGKDASDWDLAKSSEERELPADCLYAALEPAPVHERQEGKWIFAGFSLLAVAGLVAASRKRTA